VELGPWDRYPDICQVLRIPASALPQSPSGVTQPSSLGKRRSSMLCKTAASAKRPQRHCYTHPTHPSFNCTEPSAQSSQGIRTLPKLFPHFTYNRYYRFRRGFHGRKVAKSSVCRTNRRADDGFRALRRRLHIPHSGTDADNVIPHRLCELCSAVC
jgi:hypothetical protein